MSRFEFTERLCPLCGSTQSKLFLSMNVDAIFNANWSYRRQEKENLEVAGDMSFPIVQCDGCEFIYAKYLPSSDFLHIVYDRVIDADAARINNFSLSSMSYRMTYLPTLLRLLPDNKGPISVLDFGCGFGPMLNLLKALPSIKALGYENSQLRINELATQDLKATNDFVEVSASAPFSGIILDNVLEHVPNPIEILSHVRKWANADTVLYISVPDANKTFMRQQQELLAQGGLAEMEINPWEHLNYFDLTHLDVMMRKAGFEPLTQSQLPADVNIGLRPEQKFGLRIKNTFASIIRAIGYMNSGDALCTPNMRFYRLAR